jgi:4'-phosphopantetheinyl transferase EntD
MTTNIVIPAREVVAGLFPGAVAVRVGAIGTAPVSPFSEEAQTVARAIVRRRNEFFAGRALAREALADFGAPPIALPRGEDRAPVWPAGFVGSISHDREICCAVAARAQDMAALGVDVEGAAPLADAVMARVCNEREIARFARQGGFPPARWAKLAFSAKEAFYKAWFPLRGVALAFHDVEIEFAADESGLSGAFAIAIRAENHAACFAGRWRVHGARVFTGVHLRARG